MRELDFNAFASRLLDSGIAPRHVRRMVNEIRDHYDDLVDAAVDDGASRRDASRQAVQELGALDDLVTCMTAQRSLKTWAYRYPRMACVVYPLACLAVLPAKPVYVGVANAPVIMRWGASLLAAGVFTVTLLLILQLSILFG